MPRFRFACRSTIAVTGRPPGPRSFANWVLVPPPAQSVDGKGRLLQCLPKQIPTTLEDGLHRRAQKGLPKSPRPRKEDRTTSARDQPMDGCCLVDVAKPQLPKLGEFLNTKCRSTRHGLRVPYLAHSGQPRGCPCMAIDLMVPLAPSTLLNHRAPHLVAVGWLAAHPATPSTKHRRQTLAKRVSLRSHRFAPSFDVDDDRLLLIDGHATATTSPSMRLPHGTHFTHNAAHAH